MVSAANVENVEKAPQKPTVNKAITAWLRGESVWISLAVWPRMNSKMAVASTLEISVPQGLVHDMYDTSDPIP